MSAGKKQAIQAVLDEEDGIVVLSHLFNHVFVSGITLSCYQDVQGNVEQFRSMQDVLGALYDSLSGLNYWELRQCRQCAAYLCGFYEDGRRRMTRGFLL